MGGAAHAERRCGLPKRIKRGEQMYKNKKIVLGGTLACLALSVVLPMTAFANRLQFYNDDMSSYASGANPAWHWSTDGQGKQVGWFTNYIPSGTIGSSSYDFTSPVENAAVIDEPLMPQGKELTIAAGKEFGNIYYRIDTIADTTKLISLNSSLSGPKSYYMRWVMYVPAVKENVNFTYNDYHPRMTLALHSTNSNSSRYEAGVEYIKNADGNIICKPVFFDRGNGQWTNGTELQQGKYYNFLLKLDAVKTPNASDKDNVSLKVWQYGADEPAAYSLSYSFIPTSDPENIIIIEPKHYGVWNNAKHSFSDFQIDGYDGSDITNAETVFTAAQAWNPQIPSMVNNANDVNDALAAARQPDGVSVSYALNSAADGKASFNSDGTLSLIRPMGGAEDYSFALEATFTKGNAATRKSYPVTVSAHPIQTDIDAVKNADGTADITVSVTNSSEYASDTVLPTVIAACYESDGGRLLAADFNIPDAEIGAGQTLQIPINGINITDKTRLKVFVWDSFNSMQQLTEARSVHPGTKEPDSNGVIDNASGTYITVGEWYTASTEGCYRADYIYSDNGKVSMKLPVAQTGYYAVYLRHPSVSGLTEQLKINITDGEGEELRVLQNQTINGGYWVLAGTYFLKAGGQQKITLESGDGKALAFDAVQLEQTAVTDTKAKASRF